MSGTEYTFAVEEYRALRAELIERMRIDYATQRNSLIAAGGIVAFVFSNDVNFLMLAILLGVPAVCFWLRCSRYGIRSMGAGWGNT